jgi:hypothetical protein
MQRVASSKSVSARMWIVISRLFLAAVVACLLIGILGNFVAAVSFAQAADLNAEAAAAWSLNDTLAGNSLEQRGRCDKMILNSSIVTLTLWFTQGGGVAGREDSVGASTACHTVFM